MEQITVNYVDNNIIFKYLDIAIVFRYEEIQQTQYLLKPLCYPLSYHVWRVATLLYPITEIGDIQDFDNVIDILKKIISKGYTCFCTMCGKDIPISHKISSCDVCYDKFMISLTDNTITQNYNHDSLCVLLHLKIAISSLNSDRHKTIFNPFPIVYNNFDVIRDIAFTYNEEQFIQAVTTSENDNILYTKLGVLYGFIKYVLLSNKTYIRSEKIITNNKIFDEDDGLTFEKTKFLNFQIIHDDETEKMYRTNIPYFLVHGSKLENWYSIMRNGLKNYSGTAQMVNGQAYGPGIYLSDKFNFSYGYSMKYQKHTSNDKLCIIGVVQLLDDPKNYLKCPNIYVVPDEKRIILRNMIVTNGKHLDEIQTYIMDTRIKEILSYSKNYDSILLKRLNQEEKFIKTKCNFKDVIIDIHENIWTVHCGDINIRITIPINFPNIPPLLQLTDFVVENNVYIDQNNNVMLPEMEYLVWNSKTKLVNLVNHLLSVIMS